MISPALTIYDDRMGMDVHNEAFVNEIECFKEVELLYLCLRKGDSKQYFLIFDNMVENISSGPIRTNVLKCGIFYTIYSMLITFIKENVLSSKWQYHTKIHLFPQIDQFESWHEAARYLRGVSQSAFDMSEENQNKTIEAVNAVKKIINDHLHDDLSLIKLAEMVYLNPSYLSRIFKQVTGLNVSDYIKEMRLKKAKQYLMRTQMKIRDISRLTGFSSPSYFSRLFKQCTGLTPFEYRLAYATKVKVYQG